jgi:hypothetical protein
MARHAYRGLHAHFNRLSKEAQWAQMATLMPDAFVEEVAVSAVAALVQYRSLNAVTPTLTVPVETGPPLTATALTAVRHVERLRPRIPGRFESSVQAFRLAFITHRMLRTYLRR